MLDVKHLRKTYRFALLTVNNIKNGHHYYSDDRFFIDCL